MQIVTVQQLCRWLDRMQAKARCRTVSMPRSCLRSVSRHERIRQKCSTPASVRKQPEIFLFDLGHVHGAFANVVGELHRRVADEEQDIVGV